MRKSRFTESQIVKVLNEVEVGRTISDVCREYGVAEATYYNWKARYGGMAVSDIKRLKEHSLNFRKRTLSGRDYSRQT